MSRSLGGALAVALCGAFLLISVGCTSSGASDIRKVQDARGRVNKTRDIEKYPFTLKPTGDGSLDAIVGVAIQVANEKVGDMEKVVAAGSDNMFEVVNTRVEEEFKKRNLKGPTAEQRAEVRAEVSKGLSPEDRQQLASACSAYEQAAGAYRKNEKKNSEVVAKAVADLAAKAIAIKQAGGAGGAAVALSMVGDLKSNSPLKQAQQQFDYSVEVIADCDFVIKANGARATEALALMNLEGKK